MLTFHNKMGVTVLDFRSPRNRLAYVAKRSDISPALKMQRINNALGTAPMSALPRILSALRLRLMQMVRAVL